MDVLTEVFGGSSRLFLVSVILLIFATKYWFSSEKKHYRLPPGPFSLPILGTLPFLGTDIREPLRKLSDKYGDIFTVYFGSRRVIVLNSYETIKEAFVKNAKVYTGRPQDLFFIKDIQQGMGVVANEGKPWKEQRKLAHAIFRDFGVGSTYMEQRIQNEAHHLTKALSKQSNKPIQLIDYTMPAVANVIFSVCYEHRRDYDDPEFVHYLDIMNRSFELITNSGPISVFPFLRYLPGDFTGYKTLMKMVAWMKKEYTRFVQEHKDTYQEGVIRDFADAYLKAMFKEREDGRDTELNDANLFLLQERQLETLLGDLFGAGTETSTTTIGWGIIYMLYHPEIQEKIQEEIDRVIGKEEPRMSFKQDMPYTEACIQEIQRIGDIVPLGVPHTNIEDTTLCGYEIPKNTMIISNLYSVNYNEKLWPNPKKFDPSRFLDKDGKLHRSEKLIPFSMGKRVCLGESLARMEIFLFFVTLLQSFTFKLPDGDPLPDPVGNFGVTNQPKPFRVIPVPRN